MNVLSEDGVEYVAYPFQLEPGKLRHLWSVFQKHDILLSDPRRNDVDLFLDYMMSPQVVMLEVAVDDEPVGVVYADNIIGGFDACVHYIFWDLKTKGRQRLLLTILQHFMKAFHLQRVTMKIPTFAFAALNRVRHMGFWLEGRKRQAVLRNGKWEDQLLFSVLSEELTDEAVKKGTVDPEKVRGRWMKVLDDEPMLASYFLRKE